MLNLSFAFNYAVSGADVWSYHVLNLAIHLAAGLTLFGIVRRTLTGTPGGVHSAAFRFSGSAADPKRELILGALKHRFCFSRESRSPQKIIPHQEVLDAGKMAEEEGFEPPVRLPPRLISSQVP